jgi:glycine/D-amino acid oxidase-like deaminating enzyme
MTKTADVVIVGGGIIGTCVAFFLREIGFDGSILVLERDFSYRRASTTLSAASIRQQFTTPLNARMSQFSFGFMTDLPRRFGPEGEIGLVEGGYLLLAGPDRADALRANHAAVVAEGAPVALLEQAALADRFPWLNVEDIAIGTLGLAGEGWFDAYLLLAAIRRAARAAGVVYVEEAASGFVLGPGRVDAVRTASGETIACGTLVNAAGALSGRLAAMAGVALPVEPRKRTMFVVKAPLENAGMPFLFDASGVVIRPEGPGFICGVQPPPDRDPHPEEDFEPDHYLFEEVVWPALAHRVPALERLRLLSAWAGHYEMNLFDHNGVIGRVPGFDNMLVATGFSGHGVMHAPATGRGIAELIAHGRYVSLDLSPLGYERIARNAPIVEGAIY